MKRVNWCRSGWGGRFIIRRVPHWVTFGIYASNMDYPWSNPWFRRIFTGVCDRGRLPWFTTTCVPFWEEFPEPWRIISMTTGASFAVKSVQAGMRSEQGQILSCRKVGKRLFKVRIPPVKICLFKNAWPAALTCQQKLIGHRSEDRPKNPRR